MHSTVPAVLLAAFLSTVAVTPAGAADVSAAQADALQSRMQSWLRGVLIIILRSVLTRSRQNDASSMPA